MAEVAREHGWHPPKSLSRIKICRDLRTFWRSLGQKKCLFGSKTVFLEQEVHYYMVYCIFYWVKFANLRLRAKNNAFVANIVNMHLTKIFMTIFAPDERLSSFATLSNTKHTTARNSGVKDAFITNHPIIFIKKRRAARSPVLSLQCGVSMPATITTF